MRGESIKAGMGSGRNQHEARMITEQEQYTCAQILQFPQRFPAGSAAQPKALELSDSPLFEFAANAPATLPERHPHLTLFAISAAVFLAAITAEIECLRVSGYVWR